MPSSRIYSSDPISRQRRFPPRFRSRASSGRTSMALSEKEQKTLTQIDFISRIPSSMSDDGSEHEVEAFDQGRSSLRKKRRVGTTTPFLVKRQSTLTQMPFFDADGLEVDELEDGHIAMGAPSVMSSRKESWENSIFTDNALNANDQIKTEKIDRCNDQIAMDNNIFTEGAASPQQVCSPASSYHTPKQRIKSEIPCSQSTSQSACSQRHNIFSSQESPCARNPLQELPTNKLMMRDIQSQEKSNLPKQEKKRKFVPDSAASSEYEDNAENMEPDSDSDSEMAGSNSPSPIKPGRLTKSSPLQHQWNNSPALPSPLGPLPPNATFTPAPTRVGSTYNSVRTSQATTVDPTQMSAYPLTSSAARHTKRSQQNLRFPFPLQSPSNKEEPYTLATIDSQYPMDDIENLTPMSSYADASETRDLAAGIPSSSMMAEL